MQGKSLTKEKISQKTTNLQQCCVLLMKQEGCWENFVIKKVTWDKSVMCFNVVKAESKVYYIRVQKNYVTNKLL